MSQFLNSKRSGLPSASSAECILPRSHSAMAPRSAGVAGEAAVAAAEGLEVAEGRAAEALSVHYKPGEGAEGEAGDEVGRGKAHNYPHKAEADDRPENDGHRVQLPGLPTGEGPVPPKDFISG